MVPELFLQETRAVAVTVATIVNWLATFVVGFVFPYILVSWDSLSQSRDSVSTHWFYLIMMIPTDISVPIWHVNIYLPLCGNLALPLPLLTWDKGEERREHHPGAEREGRRSEGGLKKGIYILWSGKPQSNWWHIWFLECNRCKVWLQWCWTTSNGSKLWENVKKPHSSGM